MKVPFLDLRVTEADERERLLGAFERVLSHGCLVMGPEVDALERTIAEYCGRKYAVTVGSGTDALYFGLRALSIGPGDEVITTSLSWIATANAIALTGATPVFADIRADLNIDPQSVAKSITRKTKAILAVDYTGKICDMSALQDIASQNGLMLMEDGSQAFGAEYRGGRCGSFGTISGISHNPMKVFAACGEAGSLLCDSSEVYERLVSLRYNGTVNQETCIEPSLNGRMDALQAAILLERFKGLPSVIERRRNNARMYSEKLRGFVGIPTEDSHQTDVYYTYTIRSSKRNELKAYLENHGIETKVQHPLLMPQQPAYRDSAKGDFSLAKRLVEQVLCIPIHEKLTLQQLSHVVSVIHQFGPSEPGKVE